MEKVISKTVRLDINRFDSPFDALLGFRKAATLQGWTNVQILKVITQATDNSKSILSILKMYCTPE